MKDGIIKRVRRKMQIIASTILPKETLSSIYSKAVIGYKPDLKNPKTYNEKLQWYKLYYCPEHTLISVCADKYSVRDYLENKGYGNYLNKLYGVWNSANEIPWEDLPEQFVLKCTHGCAYNIICPSKKDLNIKVTINKLNKWMKEDFGKFNLERHYSNIKPRIICEKYLGGNMTDYKYFCFDGKCQFMYISEGLDHDDTATIAFFDKDGNPAKFHRNDYAINENAVIPSEFHKMKELSEALSIDFPFVRVDWFEVDEKIYFSELTFVPCAGMMKIEPPEYDLKLGALFSNSMFSYCNKHIK